MIFDFWGGKRSRTVTPGDKNYLVRIARGKCEYCRGEIIGKGIVPHIHHIVPHASGGSDREHNLIVLCPNCHSSVDHISRAELRRKISYRLPKKPSVENIPKKATRKKKTTAKKSAPKKTTSKTRLRKTTVRKTTPKKTPARKSTPKRPASKTRLKKTTPRKTTPKRTGNRRTSTRK
jgi:hypothetical protein